MLVTIDVADTEITATSPAINTLEKILLAISDSKIPFHIAESKEFDLSMGWIEGNESLVVNISQVGTITQFWTSTEAYMVNSFTAPSDLSKIQKIILKMGDSINTTV